MMMNGGKDLETLSVDIRGLSDQLQYLDNPPSENCSVRVTSALTASQDETHDQQCDGEFSGDIQPTDISSLRESVNKKSFEGIQSQKNV